LRGGKIPVGTLQRPASNDEQEITEEGRQICKPVNIDRKSEIKI